MCNCNKIVLAVKRLNENVQMPKYMTAGAAGFDIAAAETRVVFPGETVMVKTGLAFEIPKGYEMQVRPRSGMSLKTPLIMKNTVGTIDSDYRGEVCVIFHNTNDADRVGNKPYVIEAGDRIAQCILSKLPEVEIIEELGELSSTVRGAGGFGSTGVSL